MEMSTLGVAVVGTAGTIAVGIIVATWKQCCGKADSDEGVAKGKAKGGKGSADSSAKKPSKAQIKKILSTPQFSGDAAKKLVAACEDVREVKRRVAGNVDLAERINFATLLQPAVRDLSDKTMALGMITGRHERLINYVSDKVSFPYEIPALLEEAKIALGHYKKGLAELKADYADLQERALAVEPPFRKKFVDLYSSDEEVEAAEAKFDKLATALDTEFNELLDGSKEAADYFRKPAFDKMRLAIDLLARMDKRMQLESKVHVKKGKSDKAEVEDDPEPPALPPRPTDPTTGLTFRVMNQGYVADDVLTSAEQGKVDAFDQLDGTVLAARLRDLMNDNFGNFEIVNHHTIRLSKRRRLEFDVAVTATEVRATIVHAGDPTYSH